MASQILRPTGPGKRKHDQPWVIQGPWGRRMYSLGTPTDLYNRLYEELIEAGVLDKTALRPSRRHHTEVVDLIMHSSWINSQWVRDEAHGANP